MLPVHSSVTPQGVHTNYRETRTRANLFFYFLKREMGYLYVCCGTTTKEKGTVLRFHAGFHATWDRKRTMLTAMFDLVAIGF